MKSFMRTMVVVVGTAVLLGAAAPLASAQTAGATGKVFESGPNAPQYGTFQDFGDYLRVYPAGGNFYADVNGTPDDIITDPATGAATGLKFHWTMYDQRNSSNPSDWVAVYNGTLTISLAAIPPAGGGLPVMWQTTGRSLDGRDWVAVSEQPTQLVFVAD